MLKRIIWLVSTAIAALPFAASPAAAQPAPSAEASVSVPREVLERYVGRYELNGTIATVGADRDGRLTAQLAGQPPGPPLRTVSANEFVDRRGRRAPVLRRRGPEGNPDQEPLQRKRGGRHADCRRAGASPSAAAPPAPLPPRSMPPRGRPW